MALLDVTSATAASIIHDRMVNPLPVVSTGIDGIDRWMLGWGMGKGFPRGTYALIGGASNSGKTQAGLHFARNAANAGEKASFISLDMKRDDALLRIQKAIVQEIPTEHWRPDRWKPEYETMLKDGLVRWRDSIHGDLGLHAVAVGDLEWVVQSLEEGLQAGVTFFVVDHLQKIHVQGFRSPADRAEITSERLDNFCDEHGVTIIGLSQLNRDAGRDRTRKPIMQDLWGGTSMESNTQVVIMLDHSRYERVPDHPHLARTWIIVDKNQMGPKAFEVAVEINHATLEYREAKPDEVEDWPTHEVENGRKRR